MCLEKIVGYEFCLACSNFLLDLVKPMINLVKQIDEFRCVSRHL